MDDDDVRRGKLTVHRAFSEATAVLAGDALHALAFDLLADEATHEDPFVRIELTAELARASGPHGMARSEEHTSELQSLMRISYAVFCLKKKTKITGS